MDFSVVVKPFVQSNLTKTHKLFDEVNHKVFNLVLLHTVSELANIQVAV
jgi:hypothetical protein